jgi:hypothetical protein
MMPGWNKIMGVEKTDEKRKSYLWKILAGKGNEKI